MTDLTLQQKKILSELEDARKAVKTDDYSMSIGELINLYRDGEIKLNPAFQRLFRWEDHQKTKLIESILIGIPIPEIFVAQQSDGTWHVVDGVQRLSTIYQLVGVLGSSPPLILTKCKYIPALYQSNWNSLPVSVQREFKKSKIRINIILTENSDEAQYELFQRLNTGGTKLEDQEVRNCLILMVNPSFYEKLNDLKSYKNFKKCLKIRDHNFEKEFHMELILRMYMGYEGIIDYKNYDPISSTLLSDFINRETINLIKNSDFDSFIEIFKRTFDKLHSTLAENSFLKYKKDEKEFSGAFNVSVFEMIAAGVAKNIDLIEGRSDNELEEKIISMYSEPEVVEHLKHGVKAIYRFKGLTEFSKNYFRDL